MVYRLTVYIMFIKNKIDKTTLRSNTSIAGERIEDRVERMLYNQESIGDGAPLIYTDRREGVQPQYNIRTDRWDVAQEAVDKMHAKTLAKRIELYNPKNEDSINGTE